MDYSVYFEKEPYRSRLFEAMFGEIHNRMYGVGEHDLADLYVPDIISFTENDVIRCMHLYDLPDDWQEYACACIDKYFIYC